MIPSSIVPIIKCVGFSCNLRCIYCFYHQDNQSIKNLTVMRDNVLDKMIKEIFSFKQKSYSFVWHGGEPLLAGLEFFEKVIVYQKKYNVHSAFVSNRIQTNGTLLSDEWIDFIIKNRFAIGISIDGPEFIHDKYRKNIQGQGSYKTIIGNIRNAQEKGLKIAVIAVITSFSVQFPDEIYEFFISNGIKNIALNPVFEVNQDGKVCEFSVSDKDYNYFITRIIERWAKDDDPEIRVRQIQEPLDGLLLGHNTICNYSGTCSHDICIFPDGKVTPCHEMVGDRSVIFGDIKNQSLQSILSGAEYQSFQSFTLTLPKECQICQWVSVCNGGCTHHRHNLTEKYIYCGSRKKVFEILEKKIQIYNKLFLRGEKL
ncbi:MAG: radical SAM protein [Patescibacteria group bacterium]